jgi:hypothetical protein
MTIAIILIGFTKCKEESTLVFCKIVGPQQVNYNFGFFMMVGSYISRQLRMGRTVIVPKFGRFTFTAPIINLNGVNNP